MPKSSSPVVPKLETPTTCTVAFNFLRPGAHQTLTPTIIGRRWRRRDMYVISSFYKQLYHHILILIYLLKLFELHQGSCQTLVITSLMTLAYGFFIIFILLLYLLKILFLIHPLNLLNQYPYPIWCAGAAAPGAAPMLLVLLVLLDYLNFVFVL